MLARPTGKQPRLSQRSGGATTAQDSFSVATVIDSVKSFYINTTTPLILQALEESESLETVAKTIHEAASEADAAVAGYFEPLHAASGLYEAPSGYTHLYKQSIDTIPEIDGMHPDHIIDATRHTNKLIDLACSEIRENWNVVVSNLPNYFGLQNRLSKEPINTMHALIPFLQRLFLWRFVWGITGCNRVTSKKDTVGTGISSGVGSIDGPAKKQGDYRSCVDLNFNWDWLTCTVEYDPATIEIVHSNLTAPMQLGDLCVILLPALMGGFSDHNPPRHDIEYEVLVKALALPSDYLTRDRCAARGGINTAYVGLQPHDEGRRPERAAVAAGKYFPSPAHDTHTARMGHRMFGSARGMEDPRTPVKGYSRPPRTGTFYDAAQQREANNGPSKDVVVCSAVVAGTYPSTQHATSSERLTIINTADGLANSADKPFSTCAKERTGKAFSGGDVVVCRPVMASTSEMTGIRTPNLPETLSKVPEGEQEQVASTVTCNLIRAEARDEADALDPVLASTHILHASAPAKPCTDRCTTTTSSRESGNTPVEDRIDIANECVGKDGSKGDGFVCNSQTSTGDLRKLAEQATGFTSAGLQMVTKNESGDDIIDHGNNGPDQAESNSDIVVDIPTQTSTESKVIPDATNVSSTHALLPASGRELNNMDSEMAATHETENTASELEMGLDVLEHAVICHEELLPHEVQLASESLSTLASECAASDREVIGEKAVPEKLTPSSSDSALTLDTDEDGVSDEPTEVIGELADKYGSLTPQAVHFSAELSTTDLPPSLLPPIHASLPEPIVIQTRDEMATNAHTVADPANTLTAVENADQHVYTGPEGTASVLYSTTSIQEVEAGATDGTITITHSTGVARDTDNKSPVREVLFGRRVPEANLEVTDSGMASKNSVGNSRWSQESVLGSHNEVDLEVRSVGSSSRLQEQRPDSHLNSCEMPGIHDAQNIASVQKNMGADSDRAAQELSTCVVSEVGPTLVATHTSDLCQATEKVLSESVDLVAVQQRGQPSERPGTCTSVEEDRAGVKVSMECAEIHTSPEGTDCAVNKVGTGVTKSEMRADSRPAKLPHSTVVESLITAAQSKSDVEVQERPITTSPLALPPPAEISVQIQQDAIGEAQTDGGECEHSGKEEAQPEDGKKAIGTGKEYITRPVEDYVLDGSLADLGLVVVPKYIGEDLFQPDLTNSVHIAKDPFSQSDPYVPAIRDTSGAPIAQAKDGKIRSAEIHAECQDPQQEAPDERIENARAQSETAILAGTAVAQLTPRISSHSTHEDSLRVSGRDMQMEMEHQGAGASVASGAIEDTLDESESTAQPSRIGVDAHTICDTLHKQSERGEQSDVLPQEREERDVELRTTKYVQGKSDGQADKSEKLVDNAGPVLEASAASTDNSTVKINSTRDLSSAGAADDPKTSAASLRDTQPRSVVEEVTAGSVTRMHTGCESAPHAEKSKVLTHSVHVVQNKSDHSNVGVGRVASTMCVQTAGMTTTEGVAEITVVLSSDEETVSTVPTGGIGEPADLVVAGKDMEYATRSMVAARLDENKKPVSATERGGGGDESSSPSLRTADAAAVMSIQKPTLKRPTRSKQKSKTNSKKPDAVSSTEQEVKPMPKVDFDWDEFSWVESGPYTRSQAARERHHSPDGKGTEKSKYVMNPQVGSVKVDKDTTKKTKRIASPIVTTADGTERGSFLNDQKSGGVSTAQRKNSKKRSRAAKTGKDSGRTSTNLKREEHSTTGTKPRIERKRTIGHADVSVKSDLPNKKRNVRAKSHVSKAGGKSVRKFARTSGQGGPKGEKAYDDRTAHDGVQSVPVFQDTTTGQTIKQTKRATPHAQRTAEGPGASKRLKTDGTTVGLSEPDKNVCGTVPCRVKVIGPRPQTMEEKQDDNATTADGAASEAVAPIQVAENPASDDRNTAEVQQSVGRAKPTAAFTTQPVPGESISKEKVTTGESVRAEECATPALIIPEADARMQTLSEAHASKSLPGKIAQVGEALQSTPQVARLSQLQNTPGHPVPEESLPTPQAGQMKKDDDQASRTTQSKATENASQEPLAPRTLYTPLSTETIESGHTPQTTPAKNLRKRTGKTQRETARSKKTMRHTQKTHHILPKSNTPRTHQPAAAPHSEQIVQEKATDTPHAAPILPKISAEVPTPVPDTHRCAVHTHAGVNVEAKAQGTGHSAASAATPRSAHLQDVGTSVLSYPQSALGGNQNRKKGGSQVAADVAKHLFEDKYADQ